MVRGMVWCALAGLTLASLAVPPAVGEHCDTKINVYGRMAPVPAAPPPYSSRTAGFCPRVLGDAGVDEHTLPPNTDQIMVRVAGDFGPSVQSLDVEFDGLGFVDIHDTLYRTTNAAGGFTYQLADWRALPNGPVDGDLTVTVRQPGNIYRSITYETTLTVIPPPLPDV